MQLNNRALISYLHLNSLLGKVTSDEHVNVLERFCKGDISEPLLNLNGSLSRT